VPHPTAPLSFAVGGVRPSPCRFVAASLELRYRVQERLLVYLYRPCPNFASAGRAGPVPVLGIGDIVNHLNAAGPVAPAHLSSTATARLILRPASLGQFHMKPHASAWGERGSPPPNGGGFIISCGLHALLNISLIVTNYLALS
jgi:hypothetical protein